SCFNSSIESLLTGVLYAPPYKSPRGELLRPEKQRIIQSATLQSDPDEGMRWAICWIKRSSKPNEDAPQRRYIYSGRPEWVDMGPVNEVVNEALEKRRR